MDFEKLCFVIKEYFGKTEIFLKGFSEQGYGKKTGHTCHGDLFF